ncbi:MAG: hypothetical protein ABI841_02840 [Chloroflexota bacterium]
MTALRDDNLAPVLIGRVDSVRGLLVVLGVEGRPVADQLEAVATAASLPGMRDLMEPLRADLERAGLV